MVDAHARGDRGNMGESRRKYYWLVTADPVSNKPYLIFGGSTEDEARQRGLDVLGGLDFEIRALPTRHLPTASSMIRGKRLDDGHSLREASRTQGHERSLHKLVRRRVVHGN